ncbi:MAG: class I SAM-dependent methyltransferase [Candidatus Saccharibacteria bacterium]
MKEFWDNRFREEGRIWGDEPSVTAFFALKLFAEEGVKKLLIPGIGYGRNARLFAENGIEVDGIEVSGEALRHARSADLPIRCYEGSVLDMPFNDEIYDAVYSLNLLHFFRVEERAGLIEKCADQLKEGGIMFFAALSEKESGFGEGKQVEENTWERTPGRIVHYFSDDDLREHFKAFDILETGLMEDPEKHGNGREYTHILRYILARK